MYCCWLLFCLVCMLSPVPPFLWQPLGSGRPLFYGHWPKTDGQSSKKFLLFLCMIRMTQPLSAPSVSHQVATSPIVFPWLLCLMSSKPLPHLHPFWLLTLRYPLSPRSRRSFRVLTKTTLWPLLLSVASTSPHQLHPAQLITTVSQQQTLNTNWSTQGEEEEGVKALSGWRSL